MKNEVKDLLDKILQKQTGINWLIVHEVAKEATGQYSDIEFSFVNGEERRDEPFATNQGYISLNSREAIDQVTTSILELANVFKTNTLALANLYVIACRLSYSAEDDESILSQLSNTLGTEPSEEVFSLLLIDLNNTFYSEHRLFSETPANAEDWLSLFNSADYLHTISNPLLQCLKLVTREKATINYSWLKRMKPLLRAVIVGQYGYDITITQQELAEVYQKSEELAFCAACLLDDISEKKTPPDWLNKILVSQIVDKWETSGRQTLIEVFGISFRNMNSNKVYDELGVLIDEVLKTRLMTDERTTREWIEKLEFPSDFIALFGWVKSKNVDLSEVPEINVEKITIQFLSELEKILASAQEYFADHRRSDPFATYLLTKEKYGMALAYLLFFMIHSEEENVNRFRSICLGFKPFFYGARQSQYFATRFTEVILLMFLISDSISDLGENAGEMLKKYLKVISDTLLIPYVHLTERDDEIWNPESERQVLEFNAGKHLVFTAMQNIRKHKFNEYYTDFFSSINEVAIAKWI